MNQSMKLGLFLYGSIKLLFVALFSLSLMEATSAAADENNICLGKDLVAELASADPAALKMLTQQAAEIAYGNARFWKISKHGIPNSWLFGTMHMADEKVAMIPEPVRLAFDNSVKVLVEITDMLDPNLVQANLMKMKHLAFRLDGTTIESDLSGQQLAKLRSAAKARAMPYELAIRTQPWMLAPAISNQLCEVIAKRNGKPFLDIRIMKLAKQNGKQLIALETMGEQLTAIASMPADFQLSMLTETLDLGDRLDDIKQTMKKLYVNGELAMIIPVVRYFSRQMAQEGPGFSEFQDKLVTQRNIKMAERAGEHFAEGKVFMAVGALHLPGEKGLVALMKARGYSVEAVMMPVNSSRESLERITHHF